MTETPRKPILCVDFDGVLHSYTSGWKGADKIPDRPTAGAIDWLLEAVDHFRVAIFSTRSHEPAGREAMKEWLRYYLYERFGEDDPQGRFLKIWRAVEWPTDKPPAFLQIDDRAITFHGDWTAIDPERLLAFRTWQGK